MHLNFFTFPIEKNHSLEISILASLIDKDGLSSKETLNETRLVLTFVWHVLLNCLDKVLIKYIKFRTFVV